MSGEVPAESVPAVPPNSNLAVVSLVSGILGLTLFPFVGGIVALITGYMARKDIQESEGAVGGDGLATAGIIMGWISVGLMVVGFLCAGCVLIFSLSIFGIIAQEYSFLPPTFLLALS